LLEIDIDMRFQWSKLNRLQKGTYGEYLAKMEFTMYGFSVFSSEVDDRGIDFVVRNDTRQHFDVQVKTITETNYTFVVESKFNKDLVICLVILREEMEPNIYLFKGTDWSTDSTGLLNHKHYPASKEAEFGINITKSRLKHLENYKFDTVVSSLK
jgi:hypothetical protein